MTNEVKKCIALIFPEDAQDRTQRILKRLRNDNDKDHHNPGSLTYLGRCAVDHAAADLIESLSAQLEQVTRERDALLNELRGECNLCTHWQECLDGVYSGVHVDDSCWEWRGAEANQ